MNGDSNDMQKFNNRDDQYEPSLAGSNARSICPQMSIQNLKKMFQEYEPKSDLIHLEKLYHSPHLKLKKYKNSAYFGDIVNAKRHGTGIMIYDNERLYEGEWENDLKHGRGYQKFNSGCWYEGFYVNGRPEGVGRYVWPNGEIYEGEWLNGLKNGPGMWKGAKGDSYLGEWRLGKADGYGVHVWINGDRYEGEFKHCLKHGEGIQKFANGDIYKGAYVEGKPHGFGEYYWMNGSYFKGNFKKGLRDGHGMWKKSAGNSDKYEGEYCEDKKQGYGIFTWASGNIYKGNYQEDVRSGYGEMFWSDGSYYKGEWTDGIENGEGALYVPKQGTKKGIFKDNVLIEVFAKEDSSKKFKRSITNHGDSIGSKGTINSINTNYKSNLQHREKRYTSIQQSNFIKNNIHQKSRPLPPGKMDDLKHFAQKYIYFPSKTLAHKPVSSKKLEKERIPHSAFYLHKIHRRISTAKQPPSNQMVTRQKSYTNELSEAQSHKSQMIQEVKKFNTRKISSTNKSRI